MNNSENNYRIDRFVIAIISLLSIIVIVLSYFSNKGEQLTFEGEKNFYYKPIEPELGYKSERLPNDVMYRHGYSTSGGKLWRCNDDPNSLNTVPCDVSDYDLYRKCLIEKIQWNMKQPADNGTRIEPHDNQWYRNELKRNCTRCSNVKYI